MKTYLPITALALLCACGRHGYPPLPTPTRIEKPVAGPTSEPPKPPDPVPPIEDPPPPPPPPVEHVVVRRDIGQAIRSANSELSDAFFPYDRSDLTSDAIAALQKDAAILRPLLAEFPQLEIFVEGHCDERGSAEYNLGLGDHRARRAADLLVRFGVPAARIRTISYGKESPQCTDPVESCWARNRRAHLVSRDAPGPPSTTHQ
jgi:peptidoglycan-associated lipoprotein